MNGSNEFDIPGSCGQTSLEYLLILSVVLAIGVVFLKKGQEIFSNSDNSFLKRLNTQLQSQLDSQKSASARYKKFKLTE